MNVPPVSQPALSETAPPATAVFGDQFDGRHSGDFLRLQRILEHGDGFQLVFAECISVSYRQLLIERIDSRHPTAAVLDLSASSDPSALLDELRQVGPKHTPIHLYGIELWLRRAGPEALRALNYRRETLAAEVASTLVLWVEPGTIATFAAEAPDLWAWRAAVLDFSHPPTPREAVHREAIFLGSAEHSRREQRLGEIADHLVKAIDPAGPDANLLLEASDIEQSLGHPGAAQDRAAAAGTIFRRLDDKFGEARAAGRIADILQSRGDLDEALRIRTEEQVPVYERLGDVRSKAVTQGMIADILVSRGDLDEALRMLTGEVLPAFERLGDLGAKAGTQGQIADILVSRGDLDEALRMLTDEVLPAFERLGDVHLKTVTLGTIADILQSRGDLDEALRIRSEEQLPVYERLGDVRSEAVTQGKIADILQSRGDLDEALALHEQRLPIAQRMGDIESLAHIRYSTAQLRLQRGEHKTGGIQKIHDELAEAFAISVKLERPDAIGAIGRLFAQVLAMGGDHEQALEVLDQTEAAYKRLNDKSALMAIHELRALLPSTLVGGDLTVAEMRERDLL